jgi:hypothetical protein
MPRRESQNAQTKRGTWWVPLLIGVMMLFIPGGVYASPVMILLSIIMRKNKPKEKSPETPHSLLPLINITP